MILEIQALVLLALCGVALAIEVYALVDALRQRGDAFVAAGKRTKNFWVAVLGVATAVGFVSLPLGGGTGLLFFAAIAVVAAAVYLTDVRPAVRQIRGGGGRSGPYGPW
jgi:hypothetical protein